MTIDEWRALSTDKGDDEAVWLNRLGLFPKEQENYFAEKHMIGMTKFIARDSDKIIAQVYQVAPKRITITSLWAISMLKAK